MNFAPPQGRTEKLVSGARLWPEYLATSFLAHADQPPNLTTFFFFFLVTFHIFFHTPPTTQPPTLHSPVPVYTVYTPGGEPQSPPGAPPPGLRPGQPPWSPPPFLRFCCPLSLRRTDQLPNAIARDLIDTDSKNVLSVKDQPFPRRTADTRWQYTSNGKRLKPDMEAGPLQHRCFIAICERNHGEKSVGCCRATAIPQRSAKI
jgi:hypothetical protein